MSAVAASSASAAKTGPHWWVCEKLTGGIFSNSECSTSGTGWESKELLAGEARNISFTSGVTKLTTAKHTIECEKDKGTGEIIGGSPGTDKAKITFEKCTVTEGAIKCEARNKGGAFPNIVVNVNTELVYIGTKEQEEKEVPPLGILFKTATGTKTFVELEFSGLCALLNGSVTATGEETPAAEVPPRIAGVAGVVCKIVEPAEAYKFVHEIECPKPAIKSFSFWTRPGGALKEGKVGLEFNKEVSEQVGNAKIEAENAAKEKIAFDARGK